MRKVLPVSLMVAMGAAGALAQEGTGSWIPRANMLITRSEAVGSLIGDRI